MTKGIFLFFIIGISAAYSPAQHQLPTFEVASIRPNRSLSAGAKAALANGGTRMYAVGRGPLSVSGDYVRIKAVTLAELIHIAYNLPTGNVKEFYIKGLASWALPGGEYYDIQARAPDAVTANSEQVRLMVQSLLSERFRLQFHHDAREEQAYDLVISNRGLRMKQLGKPPWPTLETGQGQLEVPNIVLSVSKYLDRPLIDRTGLSGIFVYPIWTPTDVDDMSIFTLVQDRLVLKIEPVKEQLKVLVVEHVERPPDN
jgi:uncharacterized protein (TIGR03435 family)